MMTGKDFVTELMVKESESFLKLLDTRSGRAGGKCGGREAGGIEVGGEERGENGIGSEGIERGGGRCEWGKG